MLANSVWPVCSLLVKSALLWDKCQHSPGAVVQPSLPQHHSDLWQVTITAFLVTSDYWSEHCIYTELTISTPNDRNIFSLSVCLSAWWRGSWPSWRTKDLCVAVWREKVSQSAVLLGSLSIIITKHLTQLIFGANIKGLSSQLFSSWNLCTHKII